MDERGGRLFVVVGIDEAEAGAVGDAREDTKVLVLEHRLHQLDLGEALCKDARPGIDHRDLAILVVVVAVADLAGPAATPARTTAEPLRLAHAVGDGHVANDAVDLGRARAVRAVAFAGSVLVEACFGDVHQPKRLVDVGKVDLVGEADAGVRLRQTEDTEQRPGRRVGRKAVLGLVLLLLLAQTDVGRDDVFRDLARNRWPLLPGGGNEVAAALTGGRLSAPGLQIARLAQGRRTA
jgi:hypothetical protein